MDYASQSKMYLVLLLGLHKICINTILLTSTVVVTYTNCFTKWMISVYVNKWHTHSVSVHKHTHTHTHTHSVSVHSQYTHSVSIHSQYTHNVSIHSQYTHTHHTVCQYTASTHTHFIQTTKLAFKHTDSDTYRQFCVVHVVQHRRQCLREDSLPCPPEGRRSQHPFAASANGQHVTKALNYLHRADWLFHYLLCKALDKLHCPQLWKKHVLVTITTQLR